MFKRLLWLCIGMGFGFGASFFVVRAMRRTIERYTPERVSSDLSSALGQFGRDIRAAVAEGRLGMAEREAELWSEIERGNDPFRSGRPQDRPREVPQIADGAPSNN